MTNTEIYDYLRNKGITHLYHANSVATATSFINAGGLMSRGCVESYMYYQTSQVSDREDKKYDVFNDIFLDVIDLHEWEYGKKFSEQYLRTGMLDYNCKFRANLYGPVMFKVNIDKMRGYDLPQICITKVNPLFWGKHIGENTIVDFKNNHAYFNTIEEYNSSFDDKTYEKMLTIKMPNMALSIDTVDEIILDQYDFFCDCGCGESYTQVAYDSLYNALKLKSMEGKLSLRNCPRCSLCYDAHDGYDFNKMFLPKGHGNHHE